MALTKIKSTKISQPENEIIFVHEDGSPVQFYLNWKGRNSSEGLQLQSLVEDHGGIWCTSWSESAFELVLPQDTAAALRIMKPGQVFYLSSLVTESIIAKRFMDPKSFELRGPEQKKLARAHHTFTPEEDAKLLDYVRSNSKGGPSINGDVFWQLAQNELESVHSWQSLKNRFKKHLSGHLHLQLEAEGKEKKKVFNGRQLPPSIAYPPSKKVCTEEIKKIEAQNDTTTAQFEEVVVKDEFMHSSTVLKEIQIEHPKPHDFKKVPNADVSIATKAVTLTDDQSIRLKEMERGVNRLQELTDATREEVLDALVAASGDFPTAQRFLQKGKALEVWTKEEDVQLLKLASQGLSVIKSSPLAKKHSKKSLQSRLEFLTGPVQLDDS